MLAEDPSSTASIHVVGHNYNPPSHGIRHPLTTCGHVYGVQTSMETTCGHVYGVQTYIGGDKTAHLKKKAKQNILKEQEKLK